MPHMRKLGGSYLFGCFFSSPEPKGELIGWDSSRRPSVRPHFQKRTFLILTYSLNYFVVCMGKGQVIRLKLATLLEDLFEASGKLK